MNEPFYNLYNAYYELASKSFDDDYPEGSYEWNYLDGFADAMNLSYWGKEDGKLDRNLFPLHVNRKLAKRASKAYRKAHGS